MKAELCVALDGSDRKWILDMAALLAPEVGWLKIGLEAFTAHGPDLPHAVAATGARVFLDLKLHDIPNTVARAAANCAGVDMVNVHAAGGADMMRAAAQAVREHENDSRTRVIAVTLLTSLDRDDLGALGIPSEPRDLVLRWATLARESGLDGVVASPREARDIRRACGEDFLIVTPGIRPSWAEANDQRRTLTPAEAAGEGSNILVVGRPVARAQDPVLAARSITAEIEGRG